MGKSEEQRDPLEAQAAEPGVKSGEGAPRVNGSSSGKWDSAERRRRRATEATKEHRAESRRQQSGRQPTRREPGDTAATTGPSAAGAANAAAAAQGDYGVHQRQGQGRGN